MPVIVVAIIIVPS